MNEQLDNIADAEESLIRAIAYMRNCNYDQKEVEDFIKKLSYVGPLNLAEAYLKCNNNGIKTREMIEDVEDVYAMDKEKLKKLLPEEKKIDPTAYNRVVYNDDKGIFDF